MVEDVLRMLERRGTRRGRESLARYGIVAPKAFGVPVSVIQQIGRRLGRDHELALALWPTGWYEARMLTAFIADPARLTPAQMHRWAREFDNWGIVDTLCFHLFDRTPHAWPMVDRWTRSRAEFVRRAGYALLACLALHDKQAPDAVFLERLPLIDRAAPDDRNFVKKGVSWALRALGRRSLPLHRAALQAAKRLAASDEPAARWVGKDALRDLGRATVVRRLAGRTQRG